MAKDYSFFDIDGTVINKDSFRLLVLESLRHQPWRIFLMAIPLPVLLITALTKADRTIAKSMVLWVITVARGKRNTARYLRRFGETIAASHWFEQASDEIKKLENDGDSICYVSASGQIWLRGLLRTCHPSKNYRLIGTKLRFFAGGVILKSKNCYGPEKVKRIEQTLKEEPIVWKSGYSDHISDLPMMQRCQKQYFINMNSKKGLQFLKKSNLKIPILTWISTK